ncbi:MAG TPA: copper-binding protein [Burkholderiaceae bacterium]|nr:copper-binding protein [Burkholderiaceae bacterium]
MNKLFLAAALAFAGLAATAQTQPGGGHSNRHGDEMAAGEVRRVNKEQGKITLRHGEIKALDMPAMTMVFEVRDPKLLDAVKPGDKVRFRVVKEPNGAYVVTDIQPAP